MGSGINELTLNPQQATMQPLRPCLLAPIPQIFEAAWYLDEAAMAHLAGDRSLAGKLIHQADMPAIRVWTKSIWATATRHLLPQFRVEAHARDEKTTVQTVEVRMPNAAAKKLLHERDGYHCRFCGIPVIRAEVRKLLAKIYEDALPWGSTERSQHAGFQAMWAQYDHLLAHSRGGNNTEQNLVVTCAPCNFGREHYSLEEVGLADPRDRVPIRSSWDGLERLLAFRPASSPHQARQTIKSQQLTSQIIVEVGAEGDSLTLFGGKDPAGEWEFWTVTEETATFEALDEEDQVGLGRMAWAFSDGSHQ